MRKLLLLFFLLLLAALASAQEISYFVEKAFVSEPGNAFVQLLTTFDSTQVKEISLKIPSAESLRVFDAKRELTYSLQGGMLSVKAAKEEKNYSVSVELETQEITAKEGREWNAVLKVLSVQAIGNATVKLYLPKNAVLKSYNYPEKAVVLVEEESLLVQWDFQAVPAGQEIKLNASYELGQVQPAKSDIVLIGTIAAAVIAVIAIFFAYFSWYRGWIKKEEKTGQIESSQAGKEMKAEQKDILKTLTENEQEIVRELFRQGGKLSWKKLFVSTGLPKATLSRTIKSLEQKDLLESMPLGASKLLKLKKWFLEK